MTGEFSPRGGFLRSQESREGFPEEVTLKRVWSQKDEMGVWEEGDVFRDEEAAFTKVAIREWGTLEALVGPNCRQNLDEDEGKRQECGRL